MVHSIDTERGQVNSVMVLNDQLHFGNGRFFYESQLEALFNFYSLAIKLFRRLQRKGRFMQEEMTGHFGRKFTEKLLEDAPIYRLNIHISFIILLA